MTPSFLSRGVIGNTTDFGSVIQGSSPCGTAILPEKTWEVAEISI